MHWGRAKVEAGFEPSLSGIATGVTGVPYNLLLAPHAMSLASNP